ncbi:MAG: SCP-2 sterol transfer family protein [Nitrospira sp.]|jgi:putative sterol carrier protein|nr:MAG: SCP-2 sterol transfer family protein [Nitrospira sp.]
MSQTQPKTVRAFFSTLAGKLDPEAAEGLDAVYQFDLDGADGGQYQLQIRDGACHVSEGTHPDPHVTLAMSGEDCLRVLNGQVSGAAVAMSGRLRISGDVGLALQLASLFPTLRP